MAKNICVAKVIEINKPKQEVFEYLKYCQNQESFSVWNMADPTKKTSTQGVDGTKGFIYSWDSPIKNVGAGSQEIKEIIENEAIQYEIRFERPMKNIGNAQFFLSENGNSTKVTWDFSCPTKFPMSLFSGMFKKMLGKDLENSLDNLKKLLEQ